MSEKVNKSSLEEAKLNFEEIKNFAQEEIKKELQQETEKKVASILNKLVNEDVSVTINTDGNNVEVQVGDEGNVEVSKDGEAITSLGAGADKNIEDTDDSIEEPISVSDDEEVHLTDGGENEDELDELMQNQNIKEMDNIQMEDEQTPNLAAPAAQAGADATTTPATNAPGANPAESGDPQMSELLSKFDTLINILMQQNGGGATPPEGDGTGAPVDVIDDEANGATPPVGGGPGAPPVQEDMTYEIVDDTPKDIEIINDMENESMTTTPMEETRGLSFTSKRTGDKTLKLDTMKDEKGHHAPVTSLKESEELKSLSKEFKNIKAQYESHLDGLKKENSSLKQTNTKLQNERKEFEGAFVNLREQFDEMQTFNGKLYLANKLLTIGGLTQEEKTRICEKFDAAKTIKDAENLFKSIIKENKVKFSGNDVDSKIKATSTNTTKAKSTSEPLYESAEALRMKKLAGIGRNTEEEN